MTTATQDLEEMMNGWDRIMESARLWFPTATEEELYQIASIAMRSAIRTL